MRFFIILFTFSVCSEIYSVEKQLPIDWDDIVIVEIRSSDLGLKIKSEKAYYENQAHRNAFRGALGQFMNLAASKARFILIDMWFPEVFDTPEEAQLIEALRKHRNFTFLSGSMRHKERTHDRFLKLAPEAGQATYYDIKKPAIYLAPLGCRDFIHDWQPELCHPEHQERHVAVIAAEKFTGIRIDKKQLIPFEFPKKLIWANQSLSFSEFKGNPDVVTDKLVIVVQKPVPNTDIHQIDKKRRISGSEILANIIIATAYNFCRK